jgi:transcriptional regulator with AAA-type ATPase domain/pSer/pThr/pTyr-binding forkhead associated (FHA) protein
MLRLVAYAPDGVLRFPVRRRELVIGSEEACDVHLPYTGVARQHARLSYDGSEIRIEDLGSRRGVLVDGKRVKEAALELLDEIRLGGVTLLVEDVVPEQPVTEPESDSAPPAAPNPAEMTAERMLDHTARISEWVLADVESRTTSEALLEEVLHGFGGGVLLLLQGEAEQPSRAGTKLLVASETPWLAMGEELVEQVEKRSSHGIPSEGLSFTGPFDADEAWICAHAYRAVARSYVLIVALPRFSPESWSPLSALKTLGDLVILGLVHHVGSYEPILPGQGSQTGLILDPGVVVGPSEAMSRLLEELKSAVDLGVHVLLRGEPGTGKELLARSVHQSGPRRSRPFISASCGGAKPMQIEADLFGAEVPGREGAVKREGKIVLADGGTLFLDEVERLPLELQARLVRFLRSGEVEPAGSRELREVDVRLIAASRGPLDPLAARDQFRVDLAYRLSRFVIDVPPLRERREDLPLLIQSAINRFCHETGKRMQGITVKAMSALLSYHYPGNLEELDNIIRQIVYRSRSGQPIDLGDLPDEVRLAKVEAGSRVDATSDLDLERLVATAETAAIREALRRTQGNKSQAARTLGLSRNGLMMKMERYGLKV